MVEQGEELVRSLGFRELRVRHHGELARIELPLADLPRALEPEIRKALSDGLTAIGFRFVTVDLSGLRSGSLNPKGAIGTGQGIGPSTCLEPLCTREGYQASRPYGGGGTERDLR